MNIRNANATASTTGLDLRQLIILAVILVTSGASGQAFRLLASGPSAPGPPATHTAPGPSARDFARLERSVERLEERLQRLELQVEVQLKLVPRSPNP